MDKSAAKKQSAQQFANDMEAMQLQRQWDIEDRDEQRAYSRSALKHLVEDADAAGFSPLAVLGSGSAPPYNAAAGFAPLSRQAPVRQAVGGSPMGSAIGAAADAFLQTYDPYENHRKSESAKIISSAVASKNVGALTSVAPRMLGIARGASAPSARPLKSGGQQFGPSMSEYLEGNDIRDMFKRWRDPFSGKVHWLPSEDLPELEQMPIPSMGVVANETVNAVNKARDYFAPPLKRTNSKRDRYKWQPR
ncbi:MAG: hypothetical protein QUV71_07530 [Rhizobium sp.]|nr:hypothetical protein [Rhizobium sp.]MDM8015802.1 hypothetical protein [Rhizobium sp.]